MTNSPENQLALIDALFDHPALAPHFVELDTLDEEYGGKKPKIAAWNKTPLSRDQAKSLWGGYCNGSTTKPPLGICPASVGLFVVDVDGKDGVAPPSHEVQAAELAWGFMFGSDTETYIPISGKQVSSSGGVHLLWQIDLEDVEEYGHSKPQGSWQLAVRNEADLLAHGDIRFSSKGQAVVYDLPAIANAALSPHATRAQLPRSAGYGASRKSVAPGAVISNYDFELRRYARAASLVIHYGAGGTRNNYLFEKGEEDAGGSANVMADVASHCLAGPNAWHVASDMCDWGEEGRRDVERAWTSGINKIQESDEGFQVDILRFNGNGAKQENKTLRGAMKVQWADDPNCPLAHGSPKSERVDWILDTLGDTVQGFNDDFWRLLPDRNMWRTLGKSPNKTFKEALRGLIGDMDVCQRCSNDVAEPLMHRLEDRGNAERASNIPYFLQNGVVSVVEPMADSELRFGYRNFEPHMRLRPALPEDRVTLPDAQFDLGTMREDWLHTESAIERDLMRGSLGMSHEDVRWFLSWASRTLERPHKRGPFILAETGYGKSTLGQILTKIIPGRQVNSMQYEEVDKHGVDIIIDSVFITVDDMHAADRATWRQLFSKMGGVEATPRGMHKTGLSRTARPGFLINSERMYQVWLKNIFAGGAHQERFEYFLQFDPMECSKLAEGDRDRLTEEHNLQHFAWRILNAPPVMQERTENMWKARKYIEAAMKGGEKEEGTKLTVDERGKIVPPDDINILWDDASDEPSGPTEDVSNWNFDGKTITKETASGKVEVEELPSEPDHDQPSLRSSDAVVEPTSESVSDALPPWLNFSAPDPEPAPAPTPEPAKATCRCGTPGCDGWGGDACLASEDEWSAATA